MQAALATETTKVTLEETQRITSGSTFFHSIVVKNSTSINYEVVFTDNDGTEILSIAVPATKTFEYPVSFFADNGLIITGLLDSGVSVTLAFTDDTVPVAAQAVIEGKAISFDGGESMTSASMLMSIANAWTFQHIHNNNFSTLNSFLISLQAGGNVNRMQFVANGVASPEVVSVVIFDASGNTLKDYKWDLAIDVGTSVNYMWTWDGTTLIFYADGVDQVANITKTVDNSNVMTNTARTMTFSDLNGAGGAFFGADVHTVALWDVVLTPAEILALENGGTHAGVDARFPLGDYVSEDNLMHYYRLGADRSSLGRDSGNASLLVDMAVSLDDISVADIVNY